MGAEFMVNGGDGGTATVSGEYHLTLTLAGDAESLRERLASAAERLGYRILSEDPLVARRGGAGYGSITSTVLDHARTLTFRLKPAGTTTSLVTFNYIGYPLNHEGARIVIAREAEAIAALASVRQEAFTCPACGTEAVDDSRFCRRCGVPVSSAPAELQVMQLTNDAHAGTRDLLIGFIGLMLAAITFALIVGLKGTAHIKPATIFALLWTLPSMFWIVMGFRHLTRTFSARQREKTMMSESSRPSISSQHSKGVARIPPLPVTERTTELLRPILKESNPVIVKRNDDNSN